MKPDEAIARVRSHCLAQEASGSSRVDARDLARRLSVSRRFRPVRCCVASAYAGAPGDIEAERFGLYLASRCSAPFTLCDLWALPISCAAAFAAWPCLFSRRFAPRIDRGIRIVVGATGLRLWSFRLRLATRRSRIVFAGS